MIAVIGLVVNLVSAVLLSGSHSHNRAHSHGHGHHHHDHGTGAHSGDNNLRSAHVHVLADELTSVLAIAALLAGRYFGWIWLDPAIGIVGALVIARWAWSLMRDTAAVLLDATDDYVAEEVRGLVEGPGDVRIIDLRVWRIGPDAHAGIVSVAGAAGIG